MKGKHATRYNGRHLARKKMRSAASKRDDRATFRIVICGAAFVILVALKLLFPDIVSGFARSAMQLVGGDADFREAFAAVGRAVSGEDAVGESLQEAYTAVFHPSSGEEPTDEGGVEQTGDSIAKALEQDALDARSLRCAAKVLPGVENEETVAAVPEISAETETVSYTCALPDLPENTSMEQRNLGFPYVTPVQGKLTSPFGWREHPIFGGTRFHYGIDLAADTGTSICAFADATVYATGESSTLGKYIILTHADGYKTLYAHCDAILVKSGAVAVGEEIAKVGETGTATGPHLHFELHSGSLYLNPIYYVEIG